MDQIQQMINQHTQALGQFAELSLASRNHRKEASRLDKKADFLLENIVELTSQIQKAQKQQQEAEAASTPAHEIAADKETARQEAISAVRALKSEIKASK